MKGTELTSGNEAVWEKGKNDDHQVGSSTEKSKEAVTNAYLHVLTMAS
jgi:hypothetical protein